MIIARIDEDMVYEALRKAKENGGRDVSLITMNEGTFKMCEYMNSNQSGETEFFCWGRKVLIDNTLGPGQIVFYSEAEVSIDDLDDYDIRCRRANMKNSTIV